MAYTHSKYEVFMSTTELNSVSKLVSGTGEFGRWSPFYVPHIIRAIGVEILSTDSFGSPLSFSFRTASMGAASITDNQFATFGSIPTTGNLQGQVYFRDGLDQEISAGQDVVAQNLSTNTLGKARIKLYVEPRWENPANQTRLTEL